MNREVINRRCILYESGGEGGASTGIVCRALALATAANFRQDVGRSQNCVGIGHSGFLLVFVGEDRV